MKGWFAVFCAGCWPHFAVSDSAPACGGWAELQCECSALFSVLETEDHDEAFEEKLRLRAVELRQDVYHWHGKAAGDALIDRYIAQLQDGDSDLQGTIDLAEIIARCEKFLTGIYAEPKILIQP